MKTVLKNYIEKDTDKICIEVTKENLELIVSGLMLSRENKRELGAILIKEDHILNGAKIDQLSHDIEEIKKMVRNFNDLLYGGMFK